MTQTPVFHITSRAAWEAAQAAGVYRADSLDTEGFIHCSAADQVVRVANAFFRGQAGLVLLVIDPARLRAQLRYEPPADPTGAFDAGGERFPHLYGPLNLDAVARALDFSPGPDGTFVLPG